MDFDQNLTAYTPYVCKHLTIKKFNIFISISYLKIKMSKKYNNFSLSLVHYDTLAPQYISDYYTLHFE